MSIAASPTTQTLSATSTRSALGAAVMRTNSPSGGFAASSPLRGEVGETVVITASANAELLDVAGRARSRKVWVVGDAAVESDAPIERVGTQWPL